ncbi:hypothetical protein [Apilactobacillus sp. EABW-1NA]|uniref:hypothetical protein n=1 Tax=Apilactobacillus sp. EABW-1NA TaxID=2984137 RepID=UPI0025B2781B|nr:hypothetical protein [Apilactobacillus sp. EABW-1NA]MDN2613001.1 hypothetical protein [Apilactobacillus sp. EABW-1NA]
MLEFPRKASIKNEVLLFISDKDREDKDAMQIVDYVIDKVANDVANYCNIDINDIPERLDGSILGMVNQYINTHGVLPSQTDEDERLQSLTEGDVSYTFRSKGQIYQQLQSVNTITDNFTPILQRFRKLP